jgi:hypothetical protein
MQFECGIPQGRFNPRYSGGECGEHEITGITRRISENKANGNSIAPENC